MSTLTGMKTKSLELKRLRDCEARALKDSRYKFSSPSWATKGTYEEGCKQLTWKSRGSPHQE